MVSPKMPDNMQLGKIFLNKHLTNNSFTRYYYNVIKEGENNMVVENIVKEGDKAIVPVVGDTTPVTTPPETVTPEKYAKLQERFNTVEANLKGEVASLTEKLTKVVTPEALEVVKAELVAANAKLTEATSELNTTKELSLTQTRAALVKRGVAEAEVKDLDGKALAILEKVLAAGLPQKPDLSGGGGGGVLSSKNPMDMARQAYSNSK